MCAGIASLDSGHFYGRRLIPRQRVRPRVRAVTVGRDFLLRIATLGCKGGGEGMVISMLCQEPAERVGGLFLRIRLQAGHDGP